MGIMDSFKNVFGGKSEPETDASVSPSQMLRDAGVDPGGLNFGFGSDGSFTISGQISDESDRQKILDTLSGVPGINSIDDRMTVAAAPPVEEAPPEPATFETEETAPAAVGDRTYTVQSGDTLWKIAQEMYGDGSKYMKIFDANSDLLEHPDRIFPGQELAIPDLQN
jgi:nucleoid-associated protein YgaU